MVVITGLSQSHKYDSRTAPFFLLVEVDFRSKRTLSAGHVLSLFDEQKTSAPASLRQLRRKQVVQPQLVACGVFGSCYSRWKDIGRVTAGAVFFAVFHSNQPFIMCRTDNYNFKCSRRKNTYLSTLILYQALIRNPFFFYGKWSPFEKNYIKEYF